jgi:hypothetical protein
MNGFRFCLYCGKKDGKGPRELRPYGPNGADVCAECVMHNTDRNDAARLQFQKMLNDADKTTGKALLTEEGPVPYIGNIPGEKAR